MKKLLFLISFYLLISPLFGQTSKPPIFVIPPKIKGELSEIQIKFLLITLDDSLSSYFDISPPPQNKSGQCLTGCNFFQMEILEKDGVSQLSLKWKNDDFSKIESKRCVRCNTTELNEKLKDMVQNLVRGRKFEKNFVEEKKHKGVLFLRSVNGEFRWYKEGDEDNDGKYDHSTVFLDNLPYPNGVMPWLDGAIISAAPNIIFAKDKNGDQKADHVEVLFKGFGQGNQQHRMNGFEYGLDNWIYGANGDSGGVITSPKNNISVNIRGRDFRFHPKSLKFETQAGQTQFGRRRDDWGNWFGNNNFSLGWHYKFPEQYIRRNPKLIIPNNRQQIGNYDRSHIINFISKPLQRFNIVGGAENHITAANSTTPYRDELFGGNSDQLLFNFNFFFFRW